MRKKKDMNRKDTINFAPQGLNNKKKFPIYVVLIVVAVLLLGALSFVVILAKNDFDLKKALGIRAAETTDEAVTDDEETTLTEGLTGAEAGSYNFLVVCAEGKTVDFIQVISASPAARNISVHPISPDMVFETASGVRSISEIYLKGGVNDVISALETKAVPISKYVLINEENFVSLIQTLGAVDMVLQKDFSFTGDDLKYTYDAGRISMNADAFLQYMKFGAYGSELLQLQGEATAAVFRTHFTSENAEKGEEFFSRIINLVKTDISAFDYTAAAPVIKDVAAAGITVTVEN